jgi:hypothetical protein
MKDQQLETEVNQFQKQKAELKARTEEARVDNYRNQLIQKQKEGRLEAERLRLQAIEQNAINQKMYREQALSALEQQQREIQL